MAHPKTTHSHPICPTCQSDVSDRKTLAYFGGDSDSPVADDDVMALYEETFRLVGFLHALAEAGPLAVAYEADDSNGAPLWVGNFVWLAEELTKETHRRLLLLREAGLIWKSRGEQSPARNED